MCRSRPALRPRRVRERRPQRPHRIRPAREDSKRPSLRRAHGVHGAGIRTGEAPFTRPGKANRFNDFPDLLQDRARVGPARGPGRDRVRSPGAPRHRECDCHTPPNRFSPPDPSADTALRSASEPAWDGALCGASRPISHPFPTEGRSSLRTNGPYTGHRFDIEIAHNAETRWFLSLFCLVPVYPSSRSCQPRKTGRDSRKPVFHKGFGVPLGTPPVRKVQPFASRDTAGILPRADRSGAPTPLGCPGRDLGFTPGILPPMAAAVNAEESARCPFRTLPVDSRLSGASAPRSR